MQQDKPYKLQIGNTKIIIHDDKAVTTQAEIDRILNNIAKIAEQNN